MATAAHTLTVTDVEHYTESYFRIRVERPESFNFISGQFIMIGLMVDNKPLMRAYSIASPIWDEELEFYSIILELDSNIKESSLRIIESYRIL